MCLFAVLQLNFLPSSGAAPFCAMMHAWANTYQRFADWPLPVAYLSCRGQAGPWGLWISLLSSSCVFCARVDVLRQFIDGASMLGRYWLGSPKRCATVLTRPGPKGSSIIRTKLCVYNIISKSSGWLKYTHAKSNGTHLLKAAKPMFIQMECVCLIPSPYLSIPSFQVCSNSAGGHWMHFCMYYWRGGVT